MTDRPLMDPWRDAFLLRLRLRDVTGAAIGLLPRSTPTRAWQSATLAAGTVLGVEAALSGVDGAVHAVPAELSSARSWWPAWWPA